MNVTIQISPTHYIRGEYIGQPYKQPVTIGGAMRKFACVRSMGRKWCGELIELTYTAGAREAH